MRVDPDEVLVDIGYKSEGVIPAQELSIRNNANPAEVVTVGESIEALVMQMEDDNGRLVLSKKRAQYERAWGRIERVMNEGGKDKSQAILYRFPQQPGQLGFSRCTETQGGSWGDALSV